MRDFVYQEGSQTVEVPFQYCASQGTLKVGETTLPCDGTAVWLEGRRVPFWTHKEGNTVSVWYDGELHTFEERDPRQRAGANETGAGSGQLKAQMPGKILAVAVAVGDPVEIGQELLVMESMKMELSLDAQVSGTVDSVKVSPGDMVSQGQLLLEVSE